MRAVRVQIPGHSFFFFFCDNIYFILIFSLFILNSVFGADKLYIKVSICGIILLIIAFSSKDHPLGSHENSFENIPKKRYK